ncbi:hypothetical protein GCM10011396_08920 [Undibacterium terreum]|uniref:Uncharacterized protein n=1 Tax=Undibacterium terreum TaxID=1224302 RepID=A0A916XCT8_9BURK|nr:hypothetical protein GCM10011396_08920 [Undibacterium terreum]
MATPSQDNLATASKNLYLFYRCKKAAQINSVQPFSLPNLNKLPAIFPLTYLAVIVTGTVACALRPAESVTDTFRL